MANVKFLNKHKDILTIIKMYPDGCRESFIISSTNYHFTDVKQILRDLVTLGKAVKSLDNKYKVKEA